MSLDELASAAEAAGHDVEIESDGGLWIQNGADYILARSDQHGAWMRGGWRYDAQDFNSSPRQPLDVAAALAYLSGHYDAIKW